MEKGEKLPGGGRRHSKFYVAEINVYAPTSKAPLRVKQLVTCMRSWLVAPHCDRSRIN